MATNTSSGFMEGHKTNRPPFFNGSNYIYWKKRMMIYFQAIDIELWKVIVGGYSIPMEDGKPKSVVNFREDEARMCNINAKAMNALFCALNRNEFIRVYTCTSASEIWKLLEITHEGTSKVKKSKISMLSHEYETFRMVENESIVDMYTRLTHILNNLKSLGKSYANGEVVRKLLWSLPKRWDAKVTAIQETKDLNTLGLDDLIGNLVAYEMQMKHWKDDSSKEPCKNTLALKARQEESDEEMHNSDEDIARIAKKLATLLKRQCYKRQFPR